MKEEGRRKKEEGLYYVDWDANSKPATYYQVGVLKKTARMK
jgi:hypothetical protein